MLDTLAAKRDVFAGVFGSEEAPSQITFHDTGQSLMQKIDEMLGAPPVEVKLDLTPKAVPEPETAPTPTLRAFAEELFGPVAAIVVARNEDDAIRLANDSVFGLGAAVFTEDLRRGEQIAARRLEAGCCFVNDFVRSDPRLPFGGIKASGFGRELSVFGIREFVNIKTVYMKS